MKRFPFISLLFLLVFASSALAVETGLAPGSRHDENCEFSKPVNAAFSPERKQGFEFSRLFHEAVGRQSQAVYAICVEKLKEGPDPKLIDAFEGKGSVTLPGGNEIDVHSFYRAFHEKKQIEYGRCLDMFLEAVQNDLGMSLGLDMGIARPVSSEPGTSSASDLLPQGKGVTKEAVPNVSAPPAAGAEAVQPSKKAVSKSKTP